MKSVNQVEELKSRNMLAIVWNPGTLQEQDQARIVPYPIVEKKKLKEFCLPLLEIVGKVMIHGHWRARSFNGQQEFCMVNALFVSVSEMIQ